MDTATVITTENCEECGFDTEFSLNDLIAQDLSVTYVVNFFGNNAVDYEGEWVCRCGYDNSTIGQAEVQ